MGKESLYVYSVKVFPVQILKSANPLQVSRIIIRSEHTARAHVLDMNSKNRPYQVPASRLVLDLNLSDCNRSSLVSKRQVLLIAGLCSQVLSIDVHVNANHPGKRGFIRIAKRGR